MDSKTIFSKTAKGLREASGGSSDLPRALRGILKGVDGKSVLADLQGRLRKVSEADLVEALTTLIDSGYIRETNPAAQPAATTSAPPAAAADDDEFEDLDFTSLAPSMPAPSSVSNQLAEEAQRKALAAKQAADTKARLEAEQKAKLETQAKARIEAEEKSRREAAAKAKSETEEKARQLALAKAKHEAEEKAKQEALAKARREAEEKEKQAALVKAKQEAEAKARAGAEARLKIEAEEKLRREAEEKARREAEERAKQIALAKAKQEAEEKAKREAEEKAQRDAAEKFRSEAEEKARQEAQMIARKEVEARARREAEEKIQREAEEKVRREAEEKARREAEKKAREEMKAKARLDAEIQAKREAEEKARTAEQRAREEAEAIATQEAETQARIDAEQAARREAEAQQRREAEEKERLAAWELAKRKAEEKLKQEAEEKARREAEDRLRIETRERAEREAEAKLKEALKEKVRREAEEKALQEKQERIKREAEEELRKEAKEKAKREAEALAASVAAEKAAEKLDRAANRGQIRWGKLIALVSVPLLALAIGAIHLVSFNGRIPGLERQAAEQFRQPVKIDSLHLSLFPPHWRLENVAVGSAAQIKAPLVTVAVGLGGLFGSGKTFKSVEFKSPVLKEEAVNWLLFGKPQGAGIRIAQIRATDAVLESPDITLPHFDAKADLSADGKWQKMVLEFSGKDVYIELHPQDGRVQFDMNAMTFLPPFGGTLQFDDFSAKGSVGRREITVSEFAGRSLGGSFSGNANLRLAGNWSIDGTVTAKQIDSKQLAPAMLTGARIDGKAAFAMQSKEGRNLFASPHVEGTFAAGQGEVLGVDLMHVFTNYADSGRTGFRVLTGSFVRDGEVTQLRLTRLDAGILSANGSVELDAGDAVRGRFAATYKFDNQRSSRNLSLSGTLQAPKFGR